MNNPLVSVCSASYGHEKYLPDFFQSFLDQDYPNIELILTNDKSPDSSHEIIQEWITKLEDKAIKVNYFNSPINQGGFRTFEEIFRQASGKYIAILETDDYLKPESISKRVKFLEENHLFSAVHTEVDYLYENGAYTHNFWASVNRGIPSPTTWDFLMQNNSIMSCSFMANREIFNLTPLWSLYESRGYRMCDYPMALFFSQRWNIGYLPESLSVYRVLSNSASHKPETRQAFIDSTFHIQRDARKGLL